MFLIPFVILAYVVLYAFAFVLPQSLSLLLDKAQAPLNRLGLFHDQSKDPASEAETFESPLDQWLRKESATALDKLLANVAPGGRNVPDALAGSVIASPSREHPNYYFQWVRDAAITAATLANLYASQAPSCALSSKLTGILDAYTSLSHKIQHTSNPSGTFADLSGLGEPKFHANGSAFTGSWGRPQRDGPALRALALMTYLKAYNASHPSLWPARRTEGSWFKPLYNPTMPADSVIKADLEYVAQYWSRSGFDVWEEVDGMHFFTLMASRRALREGAQLATAFGDSGAAKWYTYQASELDKFLPRFWDNRKKHLVATAKSSSRSGLDCSLLLGSLHGTAGLERDDSKALFPPHSDEVLLSLITLTDDQARRFPINSAHRSSSTRFTGVGIGRYPEDVYNGYGTSPNGGNPWFLCTSASAQVLYETATHLQRRNSLRVSPLGLPFYASLLADSHALGLLRENATYSATDTVFVETVRRLREVGDEFLDVVKTHADDQGALSEQFDRVTGFERGARDLTWSYGAFLEAYWARGRIAS